MLAEGGRETWSLQGISETHKDPISFYYIVYLFRSFAACMSGPCLKSRSERCRFWKSLSQTWLVRRQRPSSSPKDRWQVRRTKDLALCIVFAHREIKLYAEISCSYPPVSLSVFPLSTFISLYSLSLLISFIFGTYFRNPEPTVHMAMAELSSSEISLASSPPPAKWQKSLGTSVWRHV